MVPAPIPVVVTVGVTTWLGLAQTCVSKTEAMTNFALIAESGVIRLGSQEAQLALFY
jgi:hypothetical protein